MGIFLSMASIVGKTKNEVANSLNNYAKTVSGGLEKEDLSADSNNCCVMEAHPIERKCPKRFR